MKSLITLASLCVTSTIAKVDRTPFMNWYKMAKPENVVYAVNCGSETPFTDKQGV